MKFKKLTKEQIYITFDRLTRFKPTKEKYLRVFTDILCSNLLEPTFSKKTIESLDFKEITKIVTKIINSSLSDDENDESFNNEINKIIQNYENSVFNNDEETQFLLENEINYYDVFKYINKDNNLPVNLLWLKSLIKNQNEYVENAKLLRRTETHKFPIELVILAEGITEEILLPAFSKYYGYDFYKMGVHIIGAGGKNQVVKMYYKLVEELKIPIFILLDKDAEENITQIKPKLRDIDRIHPVSCGEFEDLLPDNLIVKTVNSYFNNFFSVSMNDFNTKEPKAKVLESIYKDMGNTEFKKAEFAKLVRDNINDYADLSSEIKNIIKEIFITIK